MDLHLNALLPIGLILAIVAWEYVAPCRPTQQSRLYRWGNMIAIRFIGKIFFHFFMPLASVGLAIWCQQKGIGLFNNIAAPSWLVFASSILLLDFSAYCIHVAAHQMPILWRLHRTHHLDTEYDITTALRSHPLDDMQNSLAEFAFIIAFGLSPEAVIVYAVFSGIIVKFSHANAQLPDKIDRALRWILVTPDMHRIHHSAKRIENDSNYSTHFAFWDRIFRTYRAYPAVPHKEMVIGLHQFRDPSEIRVDKLLLRPFTDKE